ncbi:PAS domain S-box-containing protein/diguanylate cyclase (GGDEF) domain-containing protein [Ruminococcaceae bacterium YRB3002]|nr:PAS domain S-box-containing protein/diguanylate cyclase (GGDEF) domain-containing protein [Ruminococcaceae bacterium YRB3002]
MTPQDNIFRKISEALLMDYSSVYYVNAVTNEYYWYSVNPEFHSLSLEQGGDDFFRNIIRDCKKVIYEEDQHIFIEDIQKENLLNAMKKGSMQNIEYRLVINGVPVWHSLRLIRGFEEGDTDYFILGVINIDDEYRRREQEREIARQREVYNQITASLAGQYDTLYYIDIETNTYVEISSTDEYKKLNVPATGSDFFAESRRSIRKYVHPEDQDMIIRCHYKDVMLDNLKHRNSFSVAYRLVVNGHVKHVRHTEIMASDRKHIVVCIENIDEEVKARLELNETKRKSVTYTQIAESLAAHYDLIYYINVETEHYLEFATHKIYGELEIQEEGDGFFATAMKNADRIIYSDDRDRIKLFLDKDNLISRLDTERQLVEDYRMVVNGGDPQYTRMKISWSSDRTHFIMCVENREEDVKKEKEHLQALNMANEIARRDSLTGTRNKTAYNEYEKELQSSIDNEEDLEFGILICDLNDLKLINDTQGHKVGDEYIRTACRLICRVFAHSPVFRVGGDEFTVILRGQDYTEREVLVSGFRRQVEDNVRIGQGPIIASGMAEYQAGKDKTVEDVFQRADGRMYENKNRLKEQKMLRESRSMKETANMKTITEERRKILDSLYKSYEVVSEGTYVYLCDMKYDFSRWSKNAVDTYGLPSEYMYGAGDIWENCIHPEDREAYHKGIDEIFSGNAAGHDMQYRARRTDGKYDVCTCRGTVIRDLYGEPDYFVGTIRNHGSQGHVDTLTGLRNQYGFFEDLDSIIKRQAEVYVTIVGISKFSEINEVYGYHFGNRVLQLYARKVFEVTGNTGTCYRIDGTKFAVISSTSTWDEIQRSYRRFREYFREVFQVDDKMIMLEVNGGSVKIDRFDIDSQTVYACLNYAYGESKHRHQGDIILFYNDLNEDNRQRLEKLHAIRASIMHGYRGFYLMYQPVVDAQTEQLVGAEALLRWKNDEYGTVPPDQFIPLLESDPLFPELGEWIIRESIYAAKKLLMKNPDFVININLSYTQLEKPDFVDMVFRILEDMKYPPEHLCFEITERCRLLDIDLLKNVTTNLKARGVLIALDDFGTGFSSVGIVKELPMDIIKIDRGFVERIEEDDVDRELIRHFAGLASLFGAKVCVEGIETEGMRDILQKFHVESFQGYYYAKPLLLDKLFEWEEGK